jgi:pimeloyl-ACP methyl ester carboxylesterase
MYATDLLSLLDHLDIEQAYVVGLSMGGQIAMEFARAFPERTAALVLVPTFPEAETAEGRVERERAARRIEVEGTVAIGSEMLPKLLGRKTMKENPRLALEIFGMICSASSSGAAAAVRGRGLRQDYRSSLQHSSKSTMLVLGTDNSFMSIAVGEWLKASMHDCRLDVGHMPNLEAPDRFNRCLDSFLDSVKGTMHSQANTSK